MNIGKFIIFSVLLVLLTCIGVVTADSPTGHHWYRSSANNHNTYYSPFVVNLSISDGDVHALWSAEYEVGPTWVYNAAIDNDGNVVISTSGEAGHYIRLLNKTSGDEIWISQNGVSGYNQYNGVAIAANGDIWASSGAYYDVSCLNSTGGLEFNYFFDTPPSSSPVIGWNYVYVGVSNHIVAIDKTGVAWTSPELNGDVKGSLALDSCMNVIAVTRTGYIYSFDPYTGLERWNSSESGNGMGGSDVASQPYVVLKYLSSDETIITFGEMSEGSGRVNYFNADTGNWSCGYDDIFDSVNSGIAVTPDGGFVAHDRGRIAKFDENGIRLWIINGEYVGEDPGIFGMVVDGDGNIYVSYDLGVGIVVYDTDGNYITAFNTAETGGYDEYGSPFGIWLSEIYNMEIMEDGNLLVVMPNNIIMLGGVGDIPPEPPVANFTSNVTSGYSLFEVQFNGTSTNAVSMWAEQTLSADWEPRGYLASVVMPDDSIVLLGGTGDLDEDPWSIDYSDVWRSVDYGKNWILMNASVACIGKSEFSSVSLPNGNIVVMGGGYGLGESNASWMSSDYGATWTLMNASCGWSERWGQSSVVLSDGSIVLMGGSFGSSTDMNDVWRSTDMGATWILMNASAGWPLERGPVSVAMHDDSIVLRTYNEVWRSTDMGATWIPMTLTPEWDGRFSPSFVVLPDDSIVMMGGGFGEGAVYGEIWKSVDYGATWFRLSDPPWSPRDGFGSVVMQDGSIVIMGGRNTEPYNNDVWIYQSPLWYWDFGDGKNSTEQNATSTYDAVIRNNIVTYNVSLNVSNAVGSDWENKTSYITSYPLNASFTANITEDFPPLTVLFTDLTDNGTATSWNWSFGDGTYSSLQSPVKTYSIPGVYSVTLNASNPYSYDVENKSEYITVITEIYLISADFTANVTIGHAPLAVRFLDLSDNDPTTWVWDFGTGLLGDIYANVQNPGFEEWDAIVWNETNYRWEGNVTGWRTGLTNGTVDQYGRVDSIHITNYTGEWMPYPHSGNNFCYFHLTAPYIGGDEGFGYEPRSGWIEQDVDLTGVDNISCWLAKDYQEDYYTFNISVDGSDVLSFTDNRVNDWGEHVSGFTSSLYFDGENNIDIITDIGSLSYTGIHTVRFSWTSRYGDTHGFIDDISFNGQNPEFVYTEPGLYTVTANVGNPYGNDIEEKIDYINVTSPIVPTPIPTPEPTPVPPLEGPDIWWSAFFSALGCLLLLVLYELLRWATTPEGGKSRLKQLPP